MRLCTLVLAAGLVAAPCASGSAPAFDSGRAFEHIRQLVAIGPRPPGSDGSRQTRKYIIETLKRAGMTAVEQPFEATTPFGPIRMANVIATIPGQRPERLLIGGHYDTKLYRQFRFVGANDGGSSTAMLLELGRVLAARKPLLTIQLVFFDGEEALLPNWSAGDNTYGSRHFVEAAKKDGSLASVKGLVLVDMIGDRQLNILREGHSTRWMQDLIWESARRLGHGAAFLDEGFPLDDDHRPFLNAGVPAIDVIDLDYKVWHTADDTLEHVSARSLQIVGEVLLDALPRIQARLVDGSGKK